MNIKLFVLAMLVMSFAAALFSAWAGALYVREGRWWLAVLQAILTVPNVYFVMYWRDELRRLPR